MRKSCVLSVIFCVLFSGMLFADKPGKKSGEDWMNKGGLYAVFETSLGNIVCRLFPEQAPKTVTNFTGLAKGEIEWTEVSTGKKKKSKFYDGLKFHRVIPGFMIQGGDPQGNGRGGPGYKFGDEISKDLEFDKPGKLAMANAGPNTNGSQFFITVAPTMWLNGRHTIFGEVVEGQDVVESITKVPRNRMDMPLEPVLIKKLKIKQIKGKRPKNSK